MTAERPTFSPFWHRVRAMTPRLRPQVQITRQHYRGMRWHVAHDPTTNQFFRLSPIANEFVGLLDGTRTVEQTWELVLSRYGDHAPTQNEIISLLSQLYNSNLLRVDHSPETEQLLGRGKERTKKKIQQQAIGLMYFRVKIFNPDRALTWLEPILRPILNPVGLIAWFVLLIAALATVLPHWSELVNGFGSAVAPSNWGWIMAVFVVTKIIHETGHGVICRRFGGQVPEMGVMMLVLLPSPYVDASACWAFESKYRRMAVGAGGMIFELFVASLAAFLWTATRDTGGLAHQLAYNAMLTSGVSTVLFNANPLMRFDGYYILSDLLEVPNLMMRSTGMLNHLAQRYIYRVKNATPPSSVPSEQAILIVYGIGALIYRLFLFVSITLYIMGKLFAIGLILAVWTAAMWFILPVGKFVHWLATSPQLAEFRPRAIATSFVLLVAGALLIGAIPMPDHRTAGGIVESDETTGLFFGADGFVTKVHARPGEFVKKGEPIVTCESPELVAQLQLADAMLAEARSTELQAVAKSETANAQVARGRVEAIEAQINQARQRAERLIVRAPFDGVVVGNDPANFVGSYMKEGKQICEFVNPANLRVAASLTQSEASWLFELPHDQFSVEMRTLSKIDRFIDGTNVRIVDAGQRQLRHPALAYAGGGTIETEQQTDQRSAPQAKQHLWWVYIDAKDASQLVGGSAPGERVRLRFTLPSKPWLTQWIDRLQKAIQGRVTI